MTAPPHPPIRNIILLSDGTGNSSSSLFKTNVRRLYEALDLADPRDPAQPRQFAFYDDGVGTSGFRPLALAGGAFGYGLARNVREIYAFLCRTYRPGDRIHAFGFSRGAFTIRIVIGLILSQGILPYHGNDAALDRAVRAAYREYRRERHTRGQLLLRLRPLRDRIIERWHKLMPIEGAQPYDKARNIVPDRIEFVGVWDTVDAYGLPIEELVRAIDRFILPLNMANADLNPKVRRARQALALDEERQTFHPRLWNEHPDGKPPQDPERIRQVWFAGVHADVGGGYPDDGLAHVTLDWMLGEVERAEQGPLALRFRPEAREVIRSRADENAPIHDSRRGLASYYRYRPRDLEILRNQREHKGAAFIVQTGTPLLHESVLRRIKVGHDGYAPISSTLDVEVALVGGGHQPLAAYPGLRKAPDAAGFARGRQGVFNFVWWRRVSYFLTLAITLAIAAFPAWLEAEGCSGWACFLSPLIQAVGGFLPGMLSGWVATAAANPATLLVALGLLAAASGAGAHFDSRIRDQMRPVWSSCSGLPPLAPHMPGPSVPGPLNAWVQRLRTHRRYIGFWNFARRGLLPALAGLATLYLGYAVISIGANSAAESAGWVCDTPTGSTVFTTSSLCGATGAEVEAGGRYEVVVRIPVGDPWRDSTLEAAPNGLTVPPTRLMTLAAPLRRHWAQPWFKLMARIGEQGADSQAPDWRLVSSGTEQVYRAELAANRNGPLFLYVNDAVPLGLTWYFYGNNRGRADVSVRLLSRAHPAAP
jgi:uncharacterized protein (DUF2235 family)